jgi:hypothetical protein
MTVTMPAAPNVTVVFPGEAASSAFNMKKVSPKRARSSTAERSAHNRMVAGSNPAGPTVLAATTVTSVPSLYDTSDTAEEIRDGWCPFCETDVKIGHKGYLMVCQSCQMRID